MVNGYAPTSLQEALKLRAEHDVIPYAYKGISNCHSQFFKLLID